MANKYNDKQPKRAGIDPNQRRKALKHAAAGGAAVTLVATAGKWQKPVVDAVLLPAHAAASGGVQNMRLTVAIENNDGPIGSPSATAGRTTDFLKSGDDDGLDFQVKIHVDPPQTTPVKLSYDNVDNIDNGPSSPVDGSTNGAGDISFSFSSDDLGDTGGVNSTMEFRASTSGLPQAVVHLDFRN